MDRSGRRRRLVIAAGAALGVLLIAIGGLLIAGLLGSSPLPLPGLPNNGQGTLQRGGTDGDGLGTAPARAPAADPTSARPRATAGPTSAASPTPAPTTAK